MSRISIIVAAYNVGPYIERCLRSIQEQTLRDIEAVVVDDASTDETAQIISRIASEDDRFHVVTHEGNRGLHLARRTGVETATGELSFLLDGDDEITPTFCEELVRGYDQGPVDVLHFGITVVGENDIDPSECAAFEKFNNAPVPDLSGSDILTVIFDPEGSRSVDWRVTQRLFRTDLLKRAFERMSTERLERAEDGYECFVISDLAESYRSMKSCKGYVYYYGRGVTGTSRMGGDAFLRAASQFMACLAATESYVRRYGDACSRRCYEGMCEKDVELLMNDWHARLSDADKLAVIDELANIIGLDALSAELMRFVRDDAYAMWCSDAVLGEDCPLEAWASAARALRDGLGRSERYEVMRDDAERHLESMRRRTERWETYSKQPIRIFVSTHKDVDLFQSDILQPVQVGAAQRNWSIGYALRDNSGENISDLNSMYCELTTQYWAWKNVDAEYYGFCHYRRYFDFSPERHRENPWGEIIADRICDETQREYRLDDESMRAAIEGYDVITTEFKDLRHFPADYSTPHEHYDAAPQLNIKDLDLCMRIVKELHPDYAEDVRAFLNGNRSCFCNMFIMRKQIFRDYCAWLFPILERFMAESDMSHYSREGRRTPGHLAERLLNIYCNHHERIGSGWKTKQLQCVHFEHPERVYALQEAHSLRGLPVIPVVLAADDNYVPMLTTTIYSMMKNASRAFHYDVVVIGRNIPAERRDAMTRFFSRFDNMTLRFVDPNPIVSSYELKTNNAHIGIETYYRFLIQELLPFYDKVLYLDSDLVVEGDVAELFSVELGDDLLAAAHDIDYLGNLNVGDGAREKYSREVLGLEDPYGYFQAGVLLLNTRALRELCSVKGWLEAVSNSEYIYDDQDVLNARCQGRVHYLDNRWNVMNDCRGRVGRLFSIAPADIFDAYLAARKNPAIVHYAGADKPWNCVRCDEAERFWAHARETPFYEELLMILSGNGGGGARGSRMGSALSRAASIDSPLRRAAEPLFPIGSRRREAIKRLLRAARGR